MTSKRALLSWSDAGTVGPKPAHHAPRPSADRGPILRLLDQPESRYDAAWILTIPAGEAPSRALADEVRKAAPDALVRVVDVDDPSDYASLFAALGPVVADVKRSFLDRGWSVDILLSAGTPQAQTLWVILVQAGVLPANMLQVIPAIFVGPGRPPIRRVRLDIEGFPEIRALRREVARLRAEVRPKRSLLIGESPPMLDLKRRASRIAASDAPVLVLGETGTGKELVARAIHDQSARASGPFVAENCGVFAEGLLASELFGHEAGAFTGATGRRKGVFEQAHTGTLLLDEVGELSPRVQAALLRVLQEGTFRRVGGESKVAVDVRVVAATHKDLARMVREGSFREDLYFRLRGATIDVPPLRARPGDIELLIDVFTSDIAARRAAPKLILSPEAQRAVAAYSWPGNVRELLAEVERWGVFCEGVVEERDLPPEIRAAALGRAGEGRAPDGPLMAAHGALPPAGEREADVELAGEGSVTRPLSEIIERAERAAIETALERLENNLSAASRALGIDRNTLKRKIALYGIGGARAKPAGSPRERS